MKVIRRLHVNRQIEVDLTAVLRLPTGSRLSRGMETVCSACGKAIVDPEFIAGFAEKQPNMMFHETCLDGPAMLLLALKDAEP